MISKEVLKKTVLKLNETSVFLQKITKRKLNIKIKGLLIYNINSNNCKRRGEEICIKKFGKQKSTGVIGDAC